MTGYHKASGEQWLWMVEALGVEKRELDGAGARHASARFSGRCAGTRSLDPRARPPDRRTPFINPPWLLARTNTLPCFNRAACARTLPSAACKLFSGSAAAAVSHHGLRTQSRSIYARAARASAHRRGAGRPYARPRSGLAAGLRCYFCLCLHGRATRRAHRPLTSAARQQLRASLPPAVALPRPPRAPLPRRLRARPPAPLSGAWQLVA